MSGVPVVTISEEASDGYRNTLLYRCMGAEFTEVYNASAAGTDVGYYAAGGELFDSLSSTASFYSETADGEMAFITDAK